MKWEEKLNIFLESFEHKNDVIGILVCGSYITGTTSTHSDLDVHIILEDTVDYRERGNKIIDGLLIEYFSNPANQIRKYFEEDYKELRPMSQTQFVTGKIILDKTGVVEQLKEEAKAMMDKNFSDIDTSINELQKYGIWDMLDDLQDAYENDRKDYDLLYFTNLDKLISIYMRNIKYAYNKKTILGNINSQIVRDKYLLKELPDKDISKLIVECIENEDRKMKMKKYEVLTNKLLDLFGGFDINEFKFKSPVEK